MLNPLGKRLCKPAPSEFVKEKCRPSGLGDAQAGDLLLRATGVGAMWGCQ